MAWDATMRGAKEHKTDQEMAHIVQTRFESNDTRNGTKYSLGGLYVRPVVTHVSRKALAAIRQFNPEALVAGMGVSYARLSISKTGVTREHVIPVDATYEHLAHKFAAGELTEKYIVELMGKLEIALITQDENDMLKQANLNSRMPAGWWKSKDMDPFDRYREAQLGDDIWATPVEF